MADAQLLLWLHSSTSNPLVQQSVLQAISAMSSTHTKYLRGAYVSPLAMSLHQQITDINVVLGSPDAERALVELELYCKILSHLCGPPIVDGSSEQRKVLLYSMTTTEKASAAFLEMLEGPHRSSLALPQAVWKMLIDIAISPPSLPTNLELELMKSLVRPLTTNESDDPTTIDSLTHWMKEYIRDKLLACRGYGPAQTSSIHTIHHPLGIMLSLIPRIHQMLLDSSYASDRKQVVETALAIINGIVFVIRPSLVGTGTILDSFTVLFSLFPSESEASDVDVEIFAFGISLIFNADQSQWIKIILEVMWKRCSDG